VAVVKVRFSCRAGTAHIFKDKSGGYDAASRMTHSLIQKLFILLDKLSRRAYLIVIKNLTHAFYNRPKKGRARTAGREDACFILISDR